MNSTFLRTYRMSKIQIPSHLLRNLGPEMKMDVHWVDVLLKDQSKRKGLVVRGGAFITGRKSDPGGVGPLDFESEDIVNVRRELKIGWPKV
ncbi:MAG: hypothetical protein LAT83_14770 [Kiritimatiellae bacterium]|nr:hypothetical protein [Kiritimatiellia bacterium]